MSRPLIITLNSIKQNISPWGVSLIVIKNQLDFESPISIPWSQKTKQFSTHLCTQYFINMALRMLYGRTCLAKSKVNNIHCSLQVHKVTYLITESYPPHRLVLSLEKPQIYKATEKSSVYILGLIFSVFSKMIGKILCKENPNFVQFLVTVSVNCLFMRKLLLRYWQLCH